ncbi:MAG: DUF1638 domain-containing protein, partial [Pseudomonadota bacterium]
MIQNPSQMAIEDIDVKHIDLKPEETFDLITHHEQKSHRHQKTAQPQIERSLIIACGALAKEILLLINQHAFQNVDLTCLPASLHNRPQQIIPHLQKKLTQLRSQYRHIFIGYGDCGTGGMLDKFIEKEGLMRIEGTHCYGFFAGLDDFQRIMDEDPGSFFLTDYLARHFDHLIIKGMGIDRFPQLKDEYFRHYNRLIYLAQSDDDAL